MKNIAQELSNRAWMTVMNKLKEDYQWDSPLANAWRRTSDRMVSTRVLRHDIYNEVWNTARKNIKR